MGLLDTVKENETPDRSIKALKGNIRLVFGCSSIAAVVCYGSVEK